MWVLFLCSFLDKGSDYMPYGYSDRDWQSMTQGMKQAIKEEWERDHPSKPSQGSGTTSSIPKSTWDKMPDNIKSNIISTAQATGIDPTPGKIAGVAGTQPTPIAAEQPIVQQPTFDPYEMIRELQEEQRRQQIAAIQAAQQRALSGLESAYGQRQNTLETSKNTYLTNLENALNQQLGNLDTSLSRQQQALDTARTNYEAGLQNALGQSMQNLDSEYAKIDPYYYDARQQVQSASDIGKLNFAQYMAGRGIKGAAAGLPDIYRNATLQGQLGALGRQEAAAKGEVERARTTTQNQYETNLAAMTRNYEADMARLNQDYQNQVARLQNEYETGRGGTLNNYQSDLAALEREYLTNKQGIQEAYAQDKLSAEAGISAQGLQAFIDQINADRLFSLNEARITGRYGGQPTLEAQLAEANLTGYYGDTPTLAGQQFQQNLADTNKQSWLDTIGRFSDNYQAEINRVMNDNDLSNDWQIAYLQAARQQKIQQQQAEEAAQAAAASEAQKQQYKDALELWKMYGQATPEIAAILGVPVGARTANYDIDKLNAYIDQQKVNLDALKAAGKKDEEMPVPGSIGATFGHNAVYNDAKALKDEGYSDVEVIGYVKNSGLIAADVAAILSRLGYDDEDIDRYEAATRGTLYMGEYQQLFN
jgi:hypothetical protein